MAGEGGSGVDIATLGLRVDARQFVDATKAQEDFVQSGAKAEASVKSVEAAKSFDILVTSCATSAWTQIPASMRCTLTAAFNSFRAPSVLEAAQL